MRSAALLPQVLAEAFIALLAIVRRAVRTIFCELKVGLSSIKKLIIVCQTVRSRFCELTIRPNKNGL